jgi:AraC family transcriptional regulator
MDRCSWDGLHVVLVHTKAGATRVPASPDHRFGLHVGRPVRAVCRVDGRTHRRLQSRGDIDLVPAGMPGVWEDDRPTTMLRVHLSPARIRAAAAGLGLDPDRVELAPRFQVRDPRLEHIAWALEAELRAAEPGDTLYGESLATALAVHLVRQYRVTPGRIVEPQQGLSTRQRARMVEYIDANLDRRLSLAELAEVAGTSASHLKTLFRRTMGLPVHQYVVRRRVERARMLLEKGTGTIAEVALEVGFADQSHLARWMRRVLGVSPAEVLRRGR